VLARARQRQHIDRRDYDGLLRGAARVVTHALQLMAAMDRPRAADAVSDSRLAAAAPRAPSRPAIAWSRAAKPLRFPGCVAGQPTDLRAYVCGAGREVSRSYVLISRSNDRTSLHCDTIYCISFSCNPVAGSYGRRVLEFP
jgi:hypothetical protein